MFACAFSRHDRHKQPRYCLLSSSLVSAFNSISPHQQPRPRSISHVKDCPHASQVSCLPRMGRVEVNVLGSTSVYLGVVALRQNNLFISRLNGNSYSLHV